MTVQVLNKDPRIVLYWESFYVFNRQHVAASVPLWLTPAFQGAGDLLVL